MQWFTSCILFAVLVYGGGGVTKTSGIEQFWTDDYKIFDQVYGKTSDKDIYGDTLPLPITIGTDQTKEASKKNERYLLNYEQDSEETDPWIDHYKNILNKQTLKLYNKKKPATSMINFVSYSDFKPISQASDPETYNYLKHLEELNKQENIGFPKTVGGFKPYMNYFGPNPEDTDAYQSIQDILDAHEANKENNYKTEDDNLKAYGKNKKKKPPRLHNDVSKPRCVTSRCRKRGTGSFRSRISRPHMRGLKTVIVL